MRAFSAVILLLVLAGCGRPVPKDAADSGGDSGVDTAGDSGGGGDSGDSGAVDTATTCGDGVREGREACDDGDDNGATPCGCQVGCTWAAAATTCDDGDACTDGDACDGAGACAATPLDCDDGDPCTEDTCEAGVCHNAAFDGAATDLWDMAAVADPATLDVEIVGTDTVWEGATRVEVTEIRYTSYERDACEERPVRIEAYVAVPSGVDAAHPAPGIVVAHGLGGFADEGAASTPAAMLGAVALAYSGPGQGASEGTGSTPDHLFDTVPDPRESWFWEHALAGMRGLTVLDTLPEVDGARLGMTGYSGGGVATLMANGVDARITAAVPVSATGFLDQAARATPTPGWEADLLAAMTPPRTVDDPEWAAYVRWLDPANLLATGHGDVLLIDGAQDEFFPIHSLRDTYDGLAATGHDTRVLAIENWDHGWYALFNDEEPAERSEDAWRYWFVHQWGLDGAFSELAPMPEVVTLVPWVCFYPDAPWIYWSCAGVQARLAVPTGYRVTAAAFHWSADGSLTYGSWNLQESGDVWQAEVGTLDGAVYDASNLVYFVEFTLQDGYVGREFTLTSRPNVPAGFVPNILPIDGPLP